jgi:hypothetical protein
MTAAASQHGDAFAQRHDQAHVVLDDHDGDAARADGAHDPAELADLLAVEPGGRLVEQEQPRPPRHRPGDLDPALDAVGQRAGARPREVGQTETGQHLIRLGAQRAIVPEDPRGPQPRTRQIQPVRV